MKLSNFFGPSTLVTAAFIGPGTVTIATLAGATSGYTLLWALGFSVIATISLQEMAARLGLVTQEGMGEAIAKYKGHPFIKVLFIFIAFSAIVIGNAAYEAGNISGAVLGLEIFSQRNILMPLSIGSIAGILLFIGNYKWIEKCLVALVILMSSCFILTAMWVKPNLADIATGFIPQNLSSENILLIMALIGTTVVPYNLFLHASSISEKYKHAEDIKKMRIENNVAILLGGLVTACIIITSGTTLQGASFEVNNAKDMAIQLEPLLGSFSKYAIAAGLFAAGISSAITAPLAASYAANGLFGWKEDLKGMRFRIIWITVLLAGILFSSMGTKPILTIKFAQITNGVLLPIIAIFLIYLVNQKSLLGKYTNSKIQNVIGIFLVLITFLLAFKGLNAVFNFL